MLLGIDTLDTNLPPLHSMLLPKLPSTVLANGLFIIIVFHKALFQIKEVTWQQKKDNQWAHADGMYWSYHTSHHDEAAGLVKWCNGLLKIQLQCQQGCNTLQNCSKALHNAVVV